MKRNESKWRELWFVICFQVVLCGLAWAVVGVTYALYTWILKPIIVEVLRDVGVAVP